MIEDQTPTPELPDAPEQEQLWDSALEAAPTEPEDEKPQLEADYVKWLLSYGLYAAGWAAKDEAYWASEEELEDIKGLVTREANKRLSAEAIQGLLNITEYVEFLPVLKFLYVRILHAYRVARGTEGRTWKGRYYPGRLEKPNTEKEDNDDEPQTVDQA